MCLPRLPGFSNRPSRPSRERAVGSLVVAILLVGAGLRLLRLAHESLWMDEWLTIAATRLPIAELVSNRLQSGHAPGYFLLMKGWFAVVGESDLTLRLPSVLWGVLVIAVLYRLGRRMYGPAVGLTAAGLLAVSAIHIEYAQEGRMYTLVVLLALLAVEAAHQIVASNGVRGWSSFTLWLLVGLYTHHYVVWLAAWLLLYLWFAGRGPDRRGWWQALAVVTIGYLPFFLLVVATQVQPLPGNPEFSAAHADASWWDVYANFLVRNRVATYAPNVHQPWPVLANAALLGFALLPFAAAFLQPRSRGAVRNRNIGISEYRDSAAGRDRWLLSGWLTVPVLLAAMLGWWNPKLFGVHYLLYVSPALYLLAAAGAFGYRALPPWWRFTLASIGVVVALPTGANLIEYYRVYHKPPWRLVDENLRAKVALADAVVVVGDAAQATPVLEYYARGAYRPLKTAAPVRSQARGRLWLVGYGNADVAPVVTAVATAWRVTTVSLVDRILVVGMERQ